MKPYYLSIVLLFFLLMLAIAFPCRARAQERSYFRDLAICNGRAEKTVGLRYCDGSLKCAREVQEIQDAIITDCIDEQGWNLK